MRKNIPNIITAINLFYGCQAIVAALDDNLSKAAIFIGVAALLDFFDGFIARMLNAHSEIGRQLDSLADVVSFGVAPGIIFYKISQDYLVVHAGFMQFIPLIVVITYLPFLIPIFSAWRLARFNLDTRQEHQFIGLPTPANALFIAAIPFDLEHTNSIFFTAFTNQWFLILFPIVSSYLLVAGLPLFALKFKSMNWKENEVRYIFLLLGLLCLVLFKLPGISVVIVLYIIISIVYNRIQKKKNAI